MGQRPQPPLPADEANIIAAWHSHDSCSTSAQTFGIRPSQLEGAWRRLKAEGKLPDRPRHRYSDSSGSDNIDGRKHVDAFGDDPLLAALHRAHGKKASQ